MLVGSGLRSPSWPSLALRRVAARAPLARATNSRQRTHRPAASSPPRRGPRSSRAELRLLAPSQRARYLDGWRGVEATFAGDPEAGIALADHIVRELARARLSGGAFHELAEGLALDFPDEVEAYCIAHAVAVANEQRPVSHRQLRGAIRGYRALFAKLVAPIDSTERERDNALLRRARRARGRERRVRPPASCSRPSTPIVVVATPTPEARRRRIRRRLAEALVRKLDR